MSAEATQRALYVDHDNPWPGLASYDEAAWLYFNGRSAEIDELVRRIADEPLTVLFGRSGLGKSSLLKAGVFPQLRARHFLPIYVRLEFGGERPEFGQQMREYLKGELEEQRIEFPAWPADEPIWQYVHRSDFELWTEQNRLVRPVFVLDQFEEVFTLGRQAPAWVERFRTELADLVENRIPAYLASQLETVSADQMKLNLQATPCKFVLSLREDFLADLEEWRTAMPSLRRNRMRLLPMRAGNAKEAICNDRTRHLVDETLATEIVSFLSGRTVNESSSAADPAGGLGEHGEIDPALLSLFCARVNERRKKENKETFDGALISSARKTVVSDFYNDCLKDVPGSVRRFIEEELITEEGFRNTYVVAEALKKRRVTQAQLDDLVNCRLLRRTHLLGTERIELTHDILTNAVAQDRKRGRWVRQVVRISGYAIALLLGVGALSAYGLLQVQADREREARAKADDLVYSQSLAAMSRRERERDNERAALLGIEALKHSDTLEAREALISAATYAWPYAALPAESLGGIPLAVSVSTGGNRVAVAAGSGDGTAITLWDVNDPEGRTPHRLWVTKVAYRANALGFARDGGRIAVGGEHGIELLGTRSGERELTISDTGPVEALAFGSSGQLVWSNGRRLNVWTGDATKTRTERIELPRVSEVAFDSSGRILTLSTATAGGDLSLAVIARGRDGIWRPKPLQSDCGKPASMSVGGSRYSISRINAACGFTIDRKGDVRSDESFMRSDVQQDVGVEDVVWSKMGAAHVKVIRDAGRGGELLVVGPEFVGRWSIRLKGVDIRSKNSHVNEISISPSGLRLAVITGDDEHRRVIVHYLEQRPFLSELRKGALAVGPEGKWIVMERQPAWGSLGSTLTIYEKGSEGTFVPKQELSVGSSPERIDALKRAVVISRQAANGKNSIVERFEVNEAGVPTWSQEGTLIALLGKERSLALINVGGDAGSYRIVDVADGKLIREWDSNLLTRVRADDGLIAVQQASENADRADVTVLRATQGTIVEHATVRDVPRRQWGKLEWSPDGEMFFNDKDIWGAKGKIENDGAGAIRDLRRAQLTKQLQSPGGKYQIDVDLHDDTDLRLAVMHRASGATFGRLRMTERKDGRFSDDDRWLVFWDERGVEVLDLENRRHLTKLDISNVREASIEGTSDILRLDLGVHSMLVPLGREMTLAMAQSLVAQPFNASARCEYMGLDCQQAKALPRLAAPRLTTERKGSEGRD